MLDVSKLDLEEIAVALADQTGYDHRWLIDPESGEIVYWTADTGIDGQNRVEIEDLDLVCIDPLPSFVWYQDMVDFADQVGDEPTARRLTRALRGKGAFRRFKDELHEEYPHLLATWNAFRDIRAHRRAVEWLVENSLVEDGAGRRFLTEHPDLDVPSSMASIQASTPRVLVIGLDPYRVPGPWDPQPVAAGIEAGRTRFLEHGVGVEFCLFGLDGSDDVEAVVTAALRTRPWECVVIGGGVRSEPELLEQAINLVRRHAPDAAIAFNATPADTFAAAARWIETAGAAGTSGAKRVDQGGDA